MCGRIIFKFYKKQGKSENHETSHDIMISYMDAVVKNCEDFAKVYTYVLTKRRISKEDP